MKPRSVTFTAPDGLFAGVQVEARRNGEWHVVGANPAYVLEGREMRPSKDVTVACKLEPGDRELRCLWVYERSALGVEETTLTLDGPAASNTAGPLRKFNCGEADWLREHGVDPKQAARFPRGMTLAQIVAELNG